MWCCNDHLIPQQSPDTDAAPQGGDLPTPQECIRNRPRGEPPKGVAGFMPAHVLQSDYQTLHDSVTCIPRCCLCNVA